MAFTKNQKKETFKALAIATVKITIPGIIIGVFHEYDFWVGLLLFSYLLVFLYRNYLNRISKNWVLLIGMIITGILGICAEIWGVTNGFWEYHDLTNNRQLPYWLPFAWMFAFRFIYVLETKLIVSLQLKKMSHKTWLAICIAAFFPAYGEVITINLGVWTYSWPYQFLGVPLYAVLCLVALHMGINFLLSIWVKKKQLKDPIFINED
ncbi:hypothetical protein KCTC32516_02346 [Polaribacter huanghezhanensis]|uniref:hypothetical protein n=1 Tax=Polaribacter huanghezhanensis TaxID=1354726 RepID=UPI0026474294|nr:hypothetical protein [Polaribacter huanghezhanensis]WKD86966.1 hypothetical protein KCTC32516_02346 [Polaribacter huanghezhanensis]